MSEHLAALIEMAGLEERLLVLETKRRQHVRRRQELEAVVLKSRQELERETIPAAILEQEIQERENGSRLMLQNISKSQGQLRQVRSQRAYSTAQRQLDEARRMNQRLQDEILERRIRQEEQQPTLLHRRETYELGAAKLREHLKHSAKDLAQTEADVVRIRAELQRQAKCAGDQVASYYERLVKSGKRPAVVPVSTGHCAGCRMTFPPQEFNLLLAHNGELNRCSNCQRIVYAVTESP